MVNPAAAGSVAALFRRRAWMKAVGLGIVAPHEGSQLLQEAGRVRPPGRPVPQKPVAGSPEKGLPPVDGDCGRVLRRVRGGCGRGRLLSFGTRAIGLETAARVA